MRTGVIRAGRPLREGTQQNIVVRSEHRVLPRRARLRVLQPVSIETIRDSQYSEVARAITASRMKGVREIKNIEKIPWLRNATRRVADLYWIWRRRASDELRRKLSGRRIRRCTRREAQKKTDGLGRPSFTVAHYLLGTLTCGILRGWIGSCLDLHHGWLVRLRCVCARTTLTTRGRIRSFRWLRIVWNLVACGFHHFHSGREFQLFHGRLRRGRPCCDGLRHFHWPCLHNRCCRSRRRWGRCYLHSPFDHHMFHDGRLDHVLLDRNRTGPGFDFRMTVLARRLVELRTCRFAGTYIILVTLARLFPTVL
jgi:hypothetical protein